MLARLLTKRFGALSEETQTRLQQATYGQLNHWVDEFLMRLHKMRFLVTIK